jgi:hypothetical protein
VAIIKEKAREIFVKLKRQTPGLSSEDLEFKATTGWFARVRRRSGIKHVVMHGESASADKEAENFCRKFQEFIKKEEYLQNKFSIATKPVCFESACRTVPTSRCNRCRGFLGRKFQVSSK